MFQSPQWGSNSKVDIEYCAMFSNMFQSPQWGSNSKGNDDGPGSDMGPVSVPAMGK